MFLIEFIMTNAMDLLYNRKIEHQTEPSKLYLNVPFKLKNELKIFGIKLSSGLKQWYIYDDNIHKEKINKLIENYELLINKIVKPTKIFIHVPFKFKNEFKTKYKDVHFCKNNRQWFIYETNINREEIINIYHAGNFHIEDRPFIMSNNYDSTIMNDKLITLDEFNKN